MVDRRVALDATSPNGSGFVDPYCAAGAGLVVDEHAVFDQGILDSIKSTAQGGPAVSNHTVPDRASRRSNVNRGPIAGVDRAGDGEPVDLVLGMVQEEAGIPLWLITVVTAGPFTLRMRTPLLTVMVVTTS